MTSMSFFIYNSDYAFCMTPSFVMLVELPHA